MLHMCYVHAVALALQWNIVLYTLRVICMCIRLAHVLTFYSLTVVEIYSYVGTPTYMKQ